MNKESLLRIFLYFWLIGSLSSLILQLFFPTLIANLSLWGKATDWQREIAFWNLGISMAIIYSLVKDNLEIFRFMVATLSILSLILGTNHLVSLLINQKIMPINLLGTILNYGVAILGFYTLNTTKKI